MDGVWIEDGEVFLVRCPKCGRENYALNVTLGICTWCGYNANEHKDELGQTEPKKKGGNNGM